MLKLDNPKYGERNPMDLMAACTGVSIDRDPRRHALPQPLDALHLYWAGKAGCHRMPARSDIDPVDIPRLLGHLFLIDVSSDLLRSRFRLVGEEVVALAGRPLGRRAFSDVFEGASLCGMSLAQWFVMHHRVPLAGRCRLAFGGGHAPLVDLLLLPLGGADSPVDMVLGGVVRTAWSADFGAPMLHAAPLAPLLDGAMGQGAG